MESEGAGYHHSPVAAANPLSKSGEQLLLLLAAALHLPLEPTAVYLIEYEFEMACMDRSVVAKDIYGRGLQTNNGTAVCV
uniref:Uncharacterized protein n=1 Tax=Steinernema glaseri TaxID=37863 RepID=A0A1I7YEP9_9BILA